jgi:hypothetical protein
MDGKKPSILQFFFLLTKNFLPLIVFIVIRILGLIAFLILFNLSCKEKLDTPSQKDIFSQNEEYLYVKEPKGAYMYQAPSPSAETIDLLPKGTKVVLVEVTDEFSSIGEMDGLWAKVFYDKFEGFIFMPETQSHPPLEINSKKDRIYTCITYSNQPLESDSIDHFIFRDNGVVEHLWIDDEVLNQGLDIRYYKGKYEETKEEIKVFSLKDYKFYKYQEGHVLLTEENLIRIQREPEIQKRLQKQLDLFDEKPVQVQETLWFCQKTKKLLLD